MGMNKLDEIISIYQANGKEDLPVMIIQNGTRTNQKKVTGTVHTIQKLVQEHQLASPSIIVIGEVVQNLSKITSYSNTENERADGVFRNLNQTE
jgi:uroporphyrin-III C-methyltransferase